MRLVPALALIVLAAPLAAQQPSAPLPRRGFPADALTAQAQREQIARAVPSADTLRARMRLLSETPHEAGTDRSRRVAELILARFRSFGLEARIERFEALMPRPVSRTLELVAPERWSATLAETVLPEDKDSGDPDQLPTFNAFSPDGDVTAPLVFVNYGLPADYKVLDSLGIDVKGKIVIARYGRSWRGIKPKLAAEHGAVGCIIYSDPEDDGYFVQDPYPRGPMRPPQGVQRGSVMDMPTYPGDPLSPGWGSEPGARKLALSDVKTIEPIPVLPISYGDATPLLRALGGPVAPEPWRGALGFTYHVGPGPASVHLAVKFDWQTRPLYNVIARIPGASMPDQWIVYGNHHDAWVNGAEDPISGMVALEETARSLAALRKTGWRPARTIILAAWDGEEWGLLGSTEWAEKHADELRSKAVAYMNSDTNGRGWLGVAGSHSLQAFMEEVARDATDPKTGKSALEAVMERRRRNRPGAAPSVETQPDSARTDSLQRRVSDRVRGDLAAQRAADTLPRPGGRAESADSGYTIGALGSGSDYTAFLDHVGLASMNVAYGGEGESGIYHSIYDSFDFFTRFLDTTFAYGVAEAQTTTITLLRLADAPVLPFEFTAAERTYRRYADEIEKAAKKEPKTASLDLSAVQRALDRLRTSAVRYEGAAASVAALPSSRLRARQKQLTAVNTIVYRTERALTDSAGLPGRAWFRHLVYAPGYYTGYGVKTMPGIREAVEDKPDLATAQREAGRVAAAIDRYAAEVDRAAAGLEAALR